MMQIWSIIIIICLVLGLGLSIYFIVKSKSKDDYNSWKCTEKGCELVLSGDYGTQKKCLNACSKKENYNYKNVTFSDVKYEIDVNGKKNTSVA